MRLVVLMAVVLVSSAVAAADTQAVVCVNACPVEVKVAGLTVGVQAELTVELAAGKALEVSVQDKLGVWLLGLIPCPADVKALLFVYEGGFLKVKVSAVDPAVDLVLHTTVGAVLGLILCDLPL